MFGLFRRNLQKTSSAALKHRLEGLMSELYQRAADIDESPHRRQLTEELIRAESGYLSVLRHARSLTR